MNRYLTLILLFSTSLVLAQSAWTKKKGEAYVQLTFTGINNYNSIFGDPDYTTERQITDNTLQFYGEYGLSDKTTLLLQIPMKQIKTEGLVGNGQAFTSADSNISLGNIEFGLKHKLFENKWIGAVQLNIEANTGQYSPASGIRSGYNAWSFTPTLNIGRSFNKFYTQTFVGFSLRSNNYSSNFKIGGEFGITPINKVWLIAFIDIIKSFENGDIDLPISNQLTGLYVNDQEYFAFGFKAIGEITDEFGINIGVGGAFSGNNVAKQKALSFGLYHKF